MHQKSRHEKRVHTDLRGVQDRVEYRQQENARRYDAYTPVEFLGHVDFDHRIAVVEEESECREADKADPAQQVAELRVEADQAVRRLFDKDHAGKGMIEESGQARAVQGHSVAGVSGRRILSQKDVDRVHLRGDRPQAEVRGQPLQEEHELVQIRRKGEQEHDSGQQDQALQPGLGLSDVDQHNSHQGKKQRDRQFRHEDADHDHRQPRRPEKFVTAVAEKHHQTRHQENNPVEVVPVADVEGSPEVFGILGYIGPRRVAHCPGMRPEGQDRCNRRDRIHGQNNVKQQSLLSRPLINEVVVRRREIDIKHRDGHHIGADAHLRAPGRLPHQKDQKLHQHKGKEQLGIPVQKQSQHEQTHRARQEQVPERAQQVCHDGHRIINAEHQKAQHYEQ